MSNYREDEATQKLAAHIRQLWVEAHQDFELRTTGTATGWGSSEQAHWDGGFDAKGTFHNSSWLKIAKLCHENNLQPEILVAAMFYGVTYAPSPNQATSSFALKKYTTYNEPTTRHEIRMNILNLFEAQKSYTAANVRRLCRYGGKSEEEALRDVALTATTSLSQLFRYSILRNQNRPIAADYAEVAYRDYKRYPELYDEIWGNWIPQDLRDRLANEQKGRR